MMFIDVCTPETLQINLNYINHAVSLHGLSPQSTPQSSLTPSPMSINNAARQYLGPRLWLQLQYQWVDTSHHCLLLLHEVRWVYCPWHRYLWCSAYSAFTSVHGGRPSSEYAKLRKESLESEFGHTLGTHSSKSISAAYRFGPFLALYRAAVISFHVLKLTIWQLFLQDIKKRAVKVILHSCRPIFCILLQLHVIRLITLIAILKVFWYHFLNISHIDIGNLYNLTVSWDIDKLGTFLC